MPTFCRHGRFIERCPICRRDLPGAAPERRPRAASASSSPAAPRRAGRARPPGSTSGVRVRREQRTADDGYRSGLAPGLRASADAQRLADEVALAVGTLAALAGSVRPEDLEQATWERFLCVYLGTDEQATDWGSGELPDPDAVELGPTAAHEPGRGIQTLAAYRRWAQRAGSQGAALVGDPAWDPGRRFARAFERLALPGLGRAGRFHFLVALGAGGLYALAPDALHLLGDDDATERAAKRVFGIGDVLNLERRARALAEAAGVGLEALDLALVAWGGGERPAFGAAGERDEAAHDRIEAALGLT